MNYVSKKIQKFVQQGSEIRKMFEEGTILKKQYGVDNVFDLSLGNPIMEPPKEFYESLKDIAINQPVGIHRYMSNSGYPSTRQAIANNLSTETEMNFSENHIIMTCGAGGALNVVLKTLLNSGDNVIILSPYFVEYRFYIDNHNGKSLVVDCDENFHPNINELKETITATTKAIIINSPNNPTGVVYPIEVLNSIANVIKEKEKEFNTSIFIISDEPYRKIIYDGNEYPFLYKFHDRTIIATSHSKDLGLAGERIGYIAVNPLLSNSQDLIDAMIFCNRTLGFVNAPALMQNIIGELQDITVDIKEYTKKRDFLYTELSNIGYEIKKPEGAFYMFPKSPLVNDRDFTQLLKKQNVLVVPGSAFGKQGYFRISYCVTDEELKGSIRGFDKAYQETVK
jgi:aspartate aminotransferase